MQFLITLALRPDATPVEIDEVRAGSSKVVWDLHLAGVIRDMYARQDNAGVVFIAESPDAATLSQHLAQIPFLQRGLLVGDAVALAPFADLSLAFK